MEVVQSDPLYTDATPLVLDSSGYPHISYCSGDYYSGYDLKYTHRDAAGWHVQTVDSLGDLGASCSLALDTSDHPHISYHDATNHELKYAYESPLGWCLQTVDSEGDVGAYWSPYCSLALDGSGRAHIAYYDHANGELKYAYESSLGWCLQTVDSEGDAGVYCSLALDGSGRPNIAYYASMDGIPIGDLRYARAEFISSARELEALAGMIRLVSVAPNPFVTSTELRWEQGSPGLVEAAVFDLQGREVAVVTEGEAGNGMQHLTWRPVGLPSGAYVLRLSLNGTATAAQTLIYRR